MFFRFLAGAPALALAVPASALWVPPPEPPILVSARVPLTAADIGASVTTLNRPDLDRLQQPLLLDVLRLRPGVTVSRNGGPGGFTAVRLRGAEGEQTVLVVDGVKVADPASRGGGADFASLATAGVSWLEILRGPQSLAWGSQAIDRAMLLADVETFASRRADLLSGGERARLLAARLIAGEHRVILADEPLANLDPLHQAQMALLFRRLAAGGVTLVLVLHDRTAAARLADRALLMADGRPMAFGEANAVLQPGPLAALFGVGIDRVDTAAGPGLLPGAPLR